MNVGYCTIEPVEVRNTPALLSECIFSNANCTNGLQFSSYATASYATVSLDQFLMSLMDQF